ncbi:MAG: SDR family oxidoreductase [Bacteroidota bacterium]
MDRFKGSNFGGRTGSTGQGSTLGYFASKGAQLAIIREWAIELLPFGIRVNAIVPTEVMRPLYKKWLNSLDNSEEKLKSIVSKSLFRKQNDKS